MGKKENEESPKVKVAEKRITWVVVAVLVVGLILGAAGTVCLYEFTDLGDTKDTTTEKDKPKEEEKKPEDKQEPTEEEKPVKKEERELTKSEQEELMDAIYDIQYIDFYNKSINTPKDLDNQELMWLALSMKDEFDESIDGKSITDTLNKYLYEHDLELEDLYDWNCDTPYYKYNSNTNMLTVNEDHGGHGGGRYIKNMTNRFVEGKVNEDEYTVTVYKMFAEFNDIGMAERFYATFKDADAEENFIYEVGEIDGDLSKSEREKVLADLSEDKLQKYTYVFVKKGNDYQLKSYKIG